MKKQVFNKKMPSMLYGTAWKKSNTTKLVI